MRERALSVKWPLGRFPAAEFPGVPSAGGPDALKPRFRAGIDENHPVTARVEAGLEEERGVDHQGTGTRRGGREQGVPVPGDPRVDQGLEARPLGRLLEDDGRDGAPVDWRRQAVGLGVAAVAVAGGLLPRLDSCRAGPPGSRPVAP